MHFPPVITGASTRALSPLSIDETHLHPDSRVLVAVSGGADSMALLHALLSSGISCVAAHINHGLRGNESDSDEAFVVAHCKSLGIPINSRRIELGQSSEWVGEAAGRAGRYDTLQQIAGESDCASIAVGHTSDDFLETLLVNLVRGAAVEGLAGMPRWRLLPGGQTLIRPLWQVSRAQTRAACIAVGWTWREDSSNTDSRYLRNRLRAEVVPALAALCSGEHEGLVRQAARSAVVMRDEIDFLSEAAVEALDTIVIKREADLLVLDGLKFGELHIALRRRVLRLAAERAVGKFYRPNYEHVETARLHIEENRPRVVWCWPDGLRVEWTGPMAGNRIRLKVVGEQV